MSRAAIERRPTLDELFGPEPEAMMATFSAIMAEIDARRAESDAVRAAVEAAKAEAKVGLHLADIRAMMADEAEPACDDDQLLMAVADAHPELIERFVELVDGNIDRFRRCEELMASIEERIEERSLCRRHRFFLAPIQLYAIDSPDLLIKLSPAGDVAMGSVPEGGDVSLSVQLFSHYAHWLVTILCAAGDAALLGLQAARRALRSFAELVAHRCREAIDVARAALRCPGRALDPCPGPTRGARELIGELLAPAVLAAGGNLGAFVTRC